MATILKHELREDITCSGCWEVERPNIHHALATPNKVLFVLLRYLYLAGAHTIELLVFAANKNSDKSSLRIGSENNSLEPVQCSHLTTFPSSA